MQLKRVCVLGGSGFVGSHLISMLADRQLLIRVPTRRRERSKHLIMLPGIEVVETDIHGPEALVRLFEGCDAVINLIGVLHEQKSRFDPPEQRKGGFVSVHRDLPRKVAAACAQAGVPRLLHMSALHAGADAPSAYLRSKGAGEAAVRESALLRLAGAPAGATIAWTIFRPSVIFGPGDRFLNLFACLSRLPMLFLASPGARFQPVYVGDVARAMVESLDDPASFGRSYDLCGPRQYTLRELVDYAARVAGVRPLIYELGRLGSWLQALVLERLPGAPLTRDNLDSMKLPSVCDCGFPFPWSPASLESVAPVYLAQDNQRGAYDRFRFHAGR